MRIRLVAVVGIVDAIVRFNVEDIAVEPSRDKDVDDIRNLIRYILSVWKRITVLVHLWRSVRPQPAVNLQAFVLKSWDCVRQQLILAVDSYGLRFGSFHVSQ